MTSLFAHADLSDRWHEIFCETQLELTWRVPMACRRTAARSGAWTARRTAAGRRRRRPPPPPPPAAARGGGGGQDFFGQVPEVHWAVPELPSPPTASGLHWQRDPRYGGGATDASAVFVPDISSPENPFRCFAAAGAGDHTMKRRRRC